ARPAVGLRQDQGRRARLLPGGPAQQRPDRATQESEDRDPPALSGAGQRPLRLRFRAGPRETASEAGSAHHSIVRPTPAAWALAETRAATATSSTPLPTHFHTTPSSPTGRPLSR